MKEKFIAGWESAVDQIIRQCVAEDAVRCANRAILQRACEHLHADGHTELATAVAQIAEELR